VQQKKCIVTWRRTFKWWRAVYTTHFHPKTEGGKKYAFWPFIYTTRWFWGPENANFWNSSDAHLLITPLLIFILSFFKTFNFCFQILLGEARRCHKLCLSMFWGVGITVRELVSNTKCKPWVKWHTLILREWLRTVLLCRDWFNWDTSFSSSDTFSCSFWLACERSPDFDDASFSAFFSYIENRSQSESFLLVK